MPVPVLILSGKRKPLGDYPNNKDNNLGNRHGKGEKVTEGVLRESAEVRFADELERLTQADKANPKPQGWLRSPRAVRQFILGDEALQITPKFLAMMR